MKEKVTISRSESNLRLSIQAAGVTIFLASVCVMMLELAAGRLTAYHFGSSLYTWTGVIGITLAGLTIGNYLGGRIADYSTTKKIIGGLFCIASITCVGSIVLINSLEKWAFFWGLSWPLFSLVCIAVIFLPSPVFIGAIIPIVAKTSMDFQQQKGNTIGKIYAFGAAGSIAGTFIAGFWLIPAIGSNGVIWAAASVLLVTGLPYNLKYRLLYLWAGILVILVFIGTSKNRNLAEAGTMLFLRSKPDPNIIYEDETQYCRIRIRKKSDNPDTRIFIQDQLNHSIVTMDDITKLKYPYERIYAATTEQVIKGRDNPVFLAIGGGGFVFPRYLKHQWPAGKVNVVEIDPGVTKAAIAAFGLQENYGLNIFTMDGRNFVDDIITKKQAGQDLQQYDFIYEDAFDNFSLPYQLTTREFNEKIRAILKEDGFYMLNLIDVYNSGLVLGSVLNTLRQTFSNVYALALTFEYYGRMTFILIASQKTLDIDSVFEEIGKYYPDVWRLSKEELDALVNKNKDIILTDDYAPIDNFAAPISVQNQAAELAAIYLNNAHQRSNAGEWDQAVKLYMKAFRYCQPLSIKNYTEIIEDLLKHHEFQESYLVCKKALEYYDKPGIRTDISTINLSMSATLRELGQTEESKKYLNHAIEGFERSIQINPNAPDVLFNFGMTLASIGKSAEGREYLERAVKIDTTNQSYNFMLVRVLIDQKDYAGAETAAQNAISTMKQINNGEAVFQLQQLLEQIEYQKSHAKP